MFTINQNLIDDFADKINEKEKKNNKVTSWSSTTTDTHYPSEKLVKDSIDSIENTISNLNIGGINLSDLYLYYDEATDEIVLSTTPQYIILTSEKTIVSYANNETTQVHATYPNGSGATMELYNADTNTKIEDFTDNGDGTYTCIYESTGTGDVNLIAKVGTTTSPTLTIEDCLFYGIDTTKFTIPSNTTFSSDGEKITITTSTSSEKHIYFNHTFNQDDDFLYEVEVAQVGTNQSVALLWNNEDFWGGQDTYGNSAVAVFNNDSGSVAHTFAVGDKFKIVKENGTSSAYINDTVFKTSSATYNSTFKIGFYTNSGRTQYVKNIKIKLL